jgi:hypothetical protein
MILLFANDPYEVRVRECRYEIASEARKKSGTELPLLLLKNF